MSGVAKTIERRLQDRLSPLHLEIRDETERHIGHRGASSGGGHFRVVVVSDRFEGRALLERHRMVNEALADLFGSAIHALSMATLTQGEWRR